MTDVPPAPGSVTELVERDHRVIRGLLERFDVTATDGWGQVYRDLVQYVLRHDAAEEATLFPAVRGSMPRGDGVLDALSGEHESLAARFASMGEMDPTTPEFRSALGLLRDSLDAHLAREDQLVLPMLRALGRESERELVARFEVARAEAAPR